MQTNCWSSDPGAPGYRPVLSAVFNNPPSETFTHVRAGETVFTGETFKASRVNLCGFVDRNVTVLLYQLLFTSCILKIHINFREMRLCCVDKQ